MTDKMTAEQALEWLRTIAAISGAVVSDRPLSFSYQEAVKFQEAVKALTAPRVPEGWKSAAENAIRFVDSDMVTAYPITAAEHIKGLANLLLTAAPAPADSDPMPMPLFTTTEGEELTRLRDALDKIQAIADGYVSEGELRVMIVVQTICKQALLKGADQ